jgi:flagellum-specific peptidoglycan hydrolase FlgJ
VVSEGYKIYDSGKKAVKQYVKFIEENKDRLNPKINKGGDPKGH